MRVAGDEQMSEGSDARMEYMQAVYCWVLVDGAGEGGSSGH